MKIFITKFKDPNNRQPNYFQVPRVVYVDHLIINESQLLESTFDDYTDELIEQDNPLSFTAGDYSLRLSLLSGITSASGKTLSQFFDPSTDLNIPVGYKIAFGTDENNIERGDFIVNESIKTNYRLNDSGYILSFDVIGAEEHYIQRAEVIIPEELPEGIGIFYSSVLAGLLGASDKYNNVNFTDGTYFRFNYAGYRPEIYHAVWNAWLNNANGVNNWSLFLAFAKEHGICYKVYHKTACNPSALDYFHVRIFFLSDTLGANSFDVLDEDYIIGNSPVAKQHVGIFYTSYTSALNPDQDALGSLYIGKDSTTVGYTNLDAFGYFPENHVNNFTVNYRFTNKIYLRNNFVIHDKEIHLFGGERVYFGSSAGINIGVSLGRSLVRRVTRTGIPVPGGGTTWIYQDYGFNDIVVNTAAREYKYLVTGANGQYLECSVSFNKENPPKLFQRFSESGKQWRIHRITNRSNVDSTAKLFAVRI